MSNSIILLQADAGVAGSLAAHFSRWFDSVYIAASLDELRNSIAVYQATAVCLDMELASIAYLETLAHDFPDVRIVCNHRLADEDMWTATVNAGAVDCCFSDDLRGLLQAALGSMAAAA